jgi:hypothetical protein
MRCPQCGLLLSAGGHAHVCAQPVKCVHSAAYLEGDKVRCALCDLAAEKAARSAPVPMRLVCPECGSYHIDEGEFATRPHHTHACQDCGNVWRPAIVATVGVRFLPGFKN